MPPSETPGLLTPEERAARERRLAELRALVAERERQSEQEQAAEHAAASTPPAVCTKDAEEEEAFMQDVETHALRRPPSCTFTTLTERDLDGVVTVATERQGPPRAMGDFELLRLAKMGDLASFESFAHINGLDVKSFVDNKHRNALHYAADSGNVALLRALIDAGVGFQTDDKGLTPLDLATLNEHTAEVLELLRRAASADHTSPPTRDALLVAHAPPRPGFVLSKPVVAPSSTTTTVRRHWAALLANTAVDVGVEWHVTTITEPHADVQEVTHGLDRWLAPTTTASVHGVVSHLLRVTRAEDTAGQLRLHFLPGHCGRADGVVVAATELWVQPALRGQGVAGALLHAARQTLRAHAASRPVHVFFTTPHPLPRPPHFACVVKWFRRALRPMRVYAHAVAQEVFADFYHYDEVLRADSVLKGALPASALDANVLACWEELDDTAAAALRTFLCDARAGTAGVQLGYVPEADTSAAGQGVFVCDATHKVYARRVAGALRDVVVLRLRHPRDAAGVTVVQLAYAALSELTPLQAVEQLLQLVAQRLPETDVLLVPTHFGVTERDLVMCQFEELPAAREYVYILSSDHATTGTPVVESAQAAKLATPLFLL